MAFKEEVQRGSVGIKIGLLIEQQCDVYIHLSPRTKQWDTCAPEVILTEAGGRLTDLFGYPLNYNVPDVQNRNGLVASNGVSHDQIIETSLRSLTSSAESEFEPQIHADLRRSGYLTAKTNMTRPKPFLTYFILCAIPLLLLAGFNYWNGIRTVDSTLSASCRTISTHSTSLLTK